MQRVMIIGQPGSGKSTLARHLGAITRLPVVHMDQIHWTPGWIERSLAEKSQLTAQAHARPRWIFEGGYSSTWAERLNRADTLIWLDLPFGLRMQRILRRTLRHYGQSRPDLPHDCPERFNLDFLRFVWNTRRTLRAKAQELYDTAPHGKSLHHLQSPRRVAAYLAALQQTSAAGD